MLEVPKPAFQCEIQIRADGFHTSSIVASGLAPYGVFEFIQALLARPFLPPVEMVSKEVEPSFNPRFQGYQHAFGPDRWFHPCPPGSDVSPLLSLFRHCRGLLFLRSVFHASTFLPPLAPRVLPRFLATTEALSPSGRASSGPPSGHERRSSPDRDP